MKFLIAGLGNPGDKYAGTRHNIGFDVLDKFVAKREKKFETARYADMAKVKVKGRELVLIKPATFMNLSGNAVRYWLQKEKIAPENLLVVLDDLALPVASLRMKHKGGSAGHNGLQHIIDILGRQDFARLRVGVGNDFPKGYQSEYVLGRWDDEQEKAINDQMETMDQMIVSFATIGIERTMNFFNKKGKNNGK